MQSAPIRSIQNQISAPIEKKSPGQNQKPVKTAADAQKDNTVNFPDDTVSLSADSISQSSNNKEPSTPVSNEEKDALLRPSAAKKRISVYA